MNNILISIILNFIYRVNYTQNIKLCIICNKTLRLKWNCLHTKNYLKMVFVFNLNLISEFIIESIHRYILVLPMSILCTFPAGIYSVEIDDITVLLLDSGRSNHGYP
jgi:hypothetical protein